MDEMVDIVDENDNIIGQERKSKCHTEEILHRAASVVCFKDATYKEILLNKRSLKNKSRPGKICFPSGHLQVGESYKEGAMREFCEEMLCTKASPKIILQELFKKKNNVSGDYEYWTVFRTIYSGPFNIDRDEVEDRYFEDIKTVIQDAKQNPEKYTGTAVLILQEYQ